MFLRCRAFEWSVRRIPLAENACSGWQGTGTGVTLLAEGTFFEKEGTEQQAANREPAPPLWGGKPSKEESEAPSSH